MMAYVKYVVDTAVQLVAMYDLEYIFGGSETIPYIMACLCIIITYVLAMANYKQISYLARAVMAITGVVMIYITLVVFYKSYIQYAFVQKIEKLQTSPSLHNSTNIHHVNTADINDLRINWTLPFWPYFLNMVTQVTGIYEGIPLLPPLFSNARNQNSFETTVKYVLWTECAYVMIFSPICVLTFGYKLREIVFLNLEYGDISSFIKFNFGIVILFGVAMNFLPVPDIFANLR